MENAGNPFQPGSTNLPSSAPPAPRAAPGCRTVLSWTFVLLIGGTIYALAAAVGWGGSALVVTLGGAESTISMIGVAVLAAASTVPTVPHGMFLYSVLKA